MLSFLLCIALTQTPPSASAVPPDTAPEVQSFASIYLPHPKQTCTAVGTSAFKGLVAAAPVGLCQSVEPRLMTLAPGPRPPEVGPVPAAMRGDPVLLRLQGAVEPGDLAALIDLPRAYSWMRGASGGGTYEQVIRRLGLEAQQSVLLSGTLQAPSLVRVRGDLQGPQPKRGILASFGPALAAAWPAVVPASAIAWSTASVLPDKMWLVFETVVAGLWPLEYSFARVQLDTLEQRDGKRWVEDILGSAPRQWTVYTTATGKILETVAVLEAADGRAGAAYLGAAGAVVADIVPGLRLESGALRKTKTLTLHLPRGDGSERLVVLAFLPQAIVIAPSAAALDRHLGARGKPPAFGAAPAVAAQAFGFHMASALSRLMPVSSGRDGFAAGKASWSMTPSDDGWRLDLLYSAGK